MIPFDCLHCTFKTQTFLEKKLYEHLLPFCRFKCLIEWLCTSLLEKQMKADWCISSNWTSSFSLFILFLLSPSLSLLPLSSLLLFNFLSSSVSALCIPSSLWSSSWNQRQFWMILNLDFHAQQLQIPYFSYIRYKKFSESSLWSKHYFI